METENDTIENEGYVLTEPPTKKKKPVSKDPNPETFWNEMEKILEITRLKTKNPKWGSVRICKALSFSTNERMVRKILETYFFDEDSNSVFKKSVDLDIPHRRCCSKAEMIRIIKKNHELDHRKSASIYESIRRSVFPVVRGTVKVLFDMHVTCEECNRAVNLPKTSRTRKPIPATYTNSRWQIDLKKMPAYKGYNYVCNIVDCFSRFAFGKATKGKSAKEIAGVVLNFIYMFGAPRILQSDNGKEFRNADLEEVVKEFETVQMHGRPYHPQSQGRVERFNRTMTDYFKVKMSVCADWPDKLPEFYYFYNNRLNKATRPDTQYQLFFKRPNFSAPVDEQVPYATLTKEEREFLARAHMDVEDDDTDRSVEDHEDEEETEDGSGDTQRSDLECTVEHAAVRESISDDSLIDGNLAIAQVSDMRSLDSHGDQNIQRGVSDYYRALYDRSFNEDKTDVSTDNVQFNTAMCDVTEMYRERQRAALREFPLKQFSDNMLSSDELFPRDGQSVYFRPNPAMNKGVAVFTSGYWRPGTVLSSQTTNGGRVYEVADAQSTYKFKLNRHQIRERDF